MTTTPRPWPGARGPDLPITPWLDTISRAIASHPVTIVCGATGSGKSTRVPQCVLMADPGRRVGLTQPRRLAARAIASRIAQEAGIRLGEEVGFQTRFDRQVSSATRLKVMTDGILLQEIRRDPLLHAYDLIIIDEVHERSLNVDFLTGYLRKLLPRRPDLRVVLMSATLEAERFRAFFQQAEIVEIPGATWPVDVRYRPVEDAVDNPSALYDAVLSAVQELDAEAPGDILVFLPGEREINEATEILQGARLPGTDVLPLYARLAVPDQQRVFAPHEARHLILATNVAETSLTVPGIRHVIDSGLARIASYSARSRLQRLPITRIAQASADQRRGRCGRERAGICIRLYSEEQLLRAPRHTPPELQRSNLAGVILRLADLGLGRLEDFPLLDAPGHVAISDGYQLLRELGALDAERRLSALGRQLARLPLDPRLARMVLAAREQHCLPEVIAIVSALAAGDPRERPAAERQAADLAHAAFRDHRSDFLWFVNAWAALKREMLPLSRRQQQAWCRARYWSWRRVREWVDIHAELGARMRAGGDAAPASYRAVHRALLSGLLSRVARREQHDEYLGCRQTRLRLHPSSALRARPPRWIMAAEITETTQTYARLVAKMDPRWVTQVGRDSVRRSCSPPHWDELRGEAFVLEEISLYGLVVESGRRVALAAEDPATARDWLVQHGLVRGALGAMPPFLKHNLALAERVKAAEARARRSDLLAEEETLCAFYATRLPPTLTTRRLLLAWLRDDPARQALLTMQESDATREGVAEVTPYLFPDTFLWEGHALPLTYRYAPGEEDDGVTLTLPLALLVERVAPRLDRLVPGMLAEKIGFLLRRLPKERRRFLSPLADFTRALTAAVEHEPGTLTDALGRAITRMTGILIPAGEWREAELPAHLAIRVRLLDGSGNPMATTRDLKGWLRSAVEAPREAFMALPWPLPDPPAAEGWHFGALPERLTHGLAGLTVTGYPGLEFTASGVRVQIFGTAAAAASAHRNAVLFLLEEALRRPLQRLRKDLTRLVPLSLLAMRVGVQGGLDAPLLTAALARALGDAPLPRDPAAFTATCARVSSGLGQALESLIDWLTRVLPEAGNITAEALPPIALRWPAAARDIVAQIEGLFAPGFLLHEADRLPHYPRYLAAIRQRLERLEHNPARDEAMREQFARSAASCAARRATLTPAARARVDFLLEELRVALFAPTLKTAEKISPQRLEAFVTAAAGIDVEASAA